ncbi:MarR family winged helix-turn-helix transcriptional regulator [Nocardia iowensis]|uniref:MarR family transcriptional regulator n=1 Tax=Nocardia iowensis TaxID=204891 RepID=A0ABX8RXD9_NOCIO|nr:MarR family transcriptional regulator [Nocardia iowensis]QXN93514.1 MarR family transcriptional regulator [Nocardia iowensis]
MPDDTPTADEVWAMLTRLVMYSRDPWRRAVTERTGLPFSQIRVLRRLRNGPMTVKEVAHAAAMDAPAATVAVNKLEELGFVVREVDPTNRRKKQVSITLAGRAVLAQALATPDPAPSSVTTLPDDDLRTLRDILSKIEN